jgi:hypothetical protein
MLPGEVIVGWNELERDADGSVVVCRTQCGSTERPGATRRLSRGLTMRLVWRFLLLRLLSSLPLLESVCKLSTLGVLLHAYRLPPSLRR